MPPGHEHVGLPASPGIVFGRIVSIDAPVIGPGRAAGTPAQEEAALRHAISGALDDLASLRAAIAEKDAREILDVQVELLADPALIEDALSAIADGVRASDAWAAAMTGQIAGFEAADDDYFRARASDLRDLHGRVLRHLGGFATYAAEIGGAVFVGADLAPSRFLEIDWSGGGGIALEGGSPSSHVAMLARARGVPMVVGLGAIDLSGHTEAVADGTGGRLVLSPDGPQREDVEQTAKAARVTVAAYAEVARRPAMSADGSRVSILLNVADPAELRPIDPAICDGIGLVRTELLFHEAGAMADEEAQLSVYREILAWAGGRPVSIRTLDAGGDKPIGGYTPTGESNPFLGVRGLRLSLARPEVFLTQLRALARAATVGPLKVMLPMVTVPRELEEARRLFRTAVEALHAEGTPCALPPLGIMVEVPATALNVAAFDAAFFSIGSNDLTQYATASARDISGVAALADPSNPAVLRMIAEVVRHGRDTGREVSLCGDMAGDPAHTAALLATGLDTFSMAPNCVGRVKDAISDVMVGG